MDGVRKDDYGLPGPNRETHRKWEVIGFGREMMRAVPHGPPKRTSIWSSKPGSTISEYADAISSIVGGFTHTPIKTRRLSFDYTSWYLIAVGVLDAFAFI